MGYGDLSARRYQLLALFVMVVLFLLPSDGIGMILCPLKNLSGLDCPSCGLTRSVSSLLHLEFGRSLSYHPLGALALTGLALIAAPVRGIGQGNRTKFLEKLFQHRWQIIVALFMLVWTLRLFSGALTN